jgi:hypothetical protein
MSRTRLLQPQALRAALAAAVRRFRSKGDDAVRNGADLLG